VMKHCGSLEENEINSARYLMVGINLAKIRSVAYAMEDILWSLLSSKAAFEEAIFCCENIRYAQRTMNVYCRKHLPVQMFPRTWSELQREEIVCLVWWRRRFETCCLYVKPCRER
jgi:hypothetical protein